MQGLRRIVFLFVFLLILLAGFYCRAAVNDFKYVTAQQVIFWAPPPDFGETSSGWEPPPGYEKTASPWTPPAGFSAPEDRWQPPKGWGAPPAWKEQQPFKGKIIREEKP